MLELKISPLIHGGVIPNVGPPALKKTRVQSEHQITFLDICMPVSYVYFI